MAFLLVICTHLVRGTDQIQASFKEGESSSSVDAYPGMPGDGWAGPWEVVPKDAPMQVSVASDPAMAGNTSSPGKFVKVAFPYPMSAVPSSNLISGALCRPLEDTHGTIDLSKPYEITFDFRPDTDVNNDAIGGFVIFSGPTKGGGTGQTDTWIIREGGSTWRWVNGQRTGNGIVLSSNMSVVPGTTYHFTIDVDPTAQSWTATISDGTNTVKSDTLGFRTSSKDNSRFLGFGFDLQDPGASASASIGSLVIKSKPTPKSAN